ncbi:hypothetical protein [Mucisphaera sp.]|uniref:hypothetical protein n=1 Tax=Mucisphaera sp. TaxID=2913024 RepID=UPI003D0B082A
MLKDFPRNVQAQCTYGLDVIRLVVDNGVLYLHDIDTYGQPYRKPSPESLPRTRWLAYGSSITEASSHGYIHEAARLLKIDVLNKGMSGSCGLEESTARYLVDDCDWDFTTLEWGVNLRGRIEPDEFERRVNTALDLFVNTGRPVFVITVLPNHAHLRLGDPAVIARQNRFDEVLRDACTSRAQAHPNLSLIEGPDVLHEYSWLTADLIHPTRDGHARMGRCLADLLCKRLD